MTSSDRWETFAKDEPQWYILTHNEDLKLSPEERKRKFFASGEDDVVESLARVDSRGHGWGRALDIGCGVGRLSFPLARRFQEVYSVDVAPTMLSLLRDNAAEQGVANVTTFLPDEAWDGPPGLDYVYSLIVFQHIGDMSIIEDYIRRIGAALRPDGIAQLHFDTRPRTLVYRLRRRMPDALLPRRYRTAITRTRRSSTQLVALFGASGLTVVEEFDADSSFHTFILRRADAAGT